MADDTRPVPEPPTAPAQPVNPGSAPVGNSTPRLRLKMPTRRDESRQR